MDIFDREAVGIRGRFGVDVWEKWLSFQHSQEDFLRNYGVREERIDGTVLALKRLLEDEGIVADKNYHRANRKRASNPIFIRLLASRGVYGVGISGDIMAYVDLPIDENGTNFYWVVIDSNGDEIVGGASSSFEEATSLAENNLFRLSRELYPETYTSRRANRKRAYYDDYLESGGAFNYENPNYEYYTDREIEEGLRPQEFDGWSNRETQLAIGATSDFNVYLEVDNLAWNGTPDDIANYYLSNIDHSGYDLNLVNWEEIWEAMRDQ